MKIYGNYCLNYEDNISTLFKLCEENDKLDIWTKMSESTDELALNSVGAYFIVPIQRIPRYRLLFEV